MKIDLSQFRETFLQESSEHIVDIEDGLLHLKSSGADDETLNSIFRAAHSIKGGAGAFGLTDVVRFTHVLENLFDQMREHRIDVTTELITLLLSANDVLKELISSKDGAVPENAAEVQRALELATTSTNESGITPPKKTSNESADKQTGEAHYVVSFHPAPDLFAVGSDPILLLRNLAALGRIDSVKVDSENLPGLAALTTNVSYLAWEVELVTLAPRSEIDEVFEFVLDCATVRIGEKGAIAAQQADGPPATQKLEKNSDSIRASPRPTAARSENATVRVPTEKIDKIIDIVGEMVIAHSITTRLVEGLSAESSTELHESVASLERHIRDLHERTMSVRMLPLGSLFSRFNRLIHDLAEKTGKQLRLITEGDETEVDRGILEMLGDPLTHVLRNSADHGIETPDVRVRAGKNPEGTIRLRASHQAGTILIEVIDDGGGLNLARIREKAAARNLIASDANLSDEQVRLLIFEPGFSTKEQVSDLSGRGVGMDVVRKNVSALNGTISLDSTEGQGTHIKIQLPLTMAIMEGLIVRVESHNFVIPLVSILETVCLESNQIHNVAGQGEVAIVREEAIPFLRLRRMFGLEPSQNECEAQLGGRKLVVVVEHSSHCAALEIDELLGQQQIVVKSLERNFTKLEGTLGATILGDGKAALILDAQALITRRSKPKGWPDGKVRMSLVA
jgi:two-component system chemotaxis sensor kinase CheA